jgi:GDP-L-fucose synthase
VAWLGVRSCGVCRHGALDLTDQAAVRAFMQAARAGAEEVVIWGSGLPRREFLHVEDMAEASLFVLDLPKADYEANTQPMLSHINIGSGSDVSILELARMIAQIAGYTGRIVTDPSKPDGTPRKLLDVERLGGLGWRAGIGLRDGLEQIYRWYLQQADQPRQ